MSEYKTIFGKAVKALASDPTDTGAEGQIWYNTTTGSFRTVVATETFVAGGSLNNARSWMGSAGNKNAAIVFGGSLNPYPTFTGLTEEYDGTGWASGAAAPSPLSGIGSTGVGLQTAALNFGANGGAGYTNNSASYNGSTWTSAPNMNTTGRDRSGAGISTAALGMNSYVVGSQGVTNSEEYNGSSWTAITASGSARYEGMGLGVVTAAISCGGRKPPTNNLTSAEEYNGSSWTAIAALPQQTHKGQGGGTTTVGCVFGGVGSPYYPATPYLNNKVDYDGSTWAISPATMSNPRAYFGGDAATSSDIYAAGGQPSPFIANTEEFTTTIYSPVAATWASGATMNTQGTNSGGFGTMSAGALASTGPGTGYETYDGSTWTAQPSLNTTRTGGTAGAGSISAGLAAGGGTPTVSSANSEEYNGSSWSEGNNLGTARGALASANSGSQTAALAFSGETNPGGTLRAQTEAYDGTSWTEQNDLSDARFGGAGAGTQTAGLMMGGNPTTPGFSTATEEYNGTSWTSGGALNTGRRDLNGAGNGTQTSALVYGGEASPGFTTATEEYNGTAWSNTANLATAAGLRSGFNSGGNTAAIAAGPSLSTEEYTGVTQVLDYKTITTS